MPSSPSPPRPQVQALLRDAKECSWDDLPRLILADWMEENGATCAERALGEYIRLGVHRARRWLYDDSVRLWWDRQGGREEELERRHAADWLGDLLDRVRWEPARGLFNIAVQPADLTGLRPPLPEGWAWIGELAFLGGLHRAAPLFSSSLVEAIGTLDLSGAQLRPQDWEVLRTCPRLGDLPGLVTDRADGWSWPCLTGLTAFTYHADPHVGSAYDLDALPHSPRLAQLNCLRISRCFLDASFLAALARAPGAASLRRLDLIAAGLRDDHVIDLACSPYLTGLRMLSLADNQAVSDEGLCALALGRLPLETLALHGTSVRPPGVIALLDGPLAARLTWLSLPQAAVDLATARALAYAPQLSRLERLFVHSFDLPPRIRAVLRERFADRLIL